MAMRKHYLPNVLDIAPDDLYLIEDSAHIASYARVNQGKRVCLNERIGQDSAIEVDRPKVGQDLRAWIMHRSQGGACRLLAIARLFPASGLMSSMNRKFGARRKQYGLPSAWQGTTTEAQCWR